MMGILRANLKHFYQRRSVWLWYLIILCQMPMVLLCIYSKVDRFLGYLIASLLIGILVGAFQKDVLSKPFSFCLPGHRHIARPLIFWIGSSINLIFGCVFLGYQGLSFPYVLLVILAGGFAGILIYFYGVHVGLVELPSPSAGLLGLLIPGTIFLKWDMALQYIIVHQPILVILVAVLVCVWVWRLLGRDILARKYCGKLVMGVLDSWDKNKALKYRQAKLAEKEKKKKRNLMRISSGVEKFFVSRISRAEAGSLQQYIWGGFYKTFGLMISQYRWEWMRFLIVMLPAICFLCYIPGGSKNMLFFLPGIMVVNMGLHVHSSLLISGSRRERFWSALTLAVTTGILISVVVMLFAMITQLLVGVMPALTVKGHEFTFSALDINLSFVPFLMVPIALMLSLIFNKKPILAMLCVMVFFQIFFALSIFGKVSIPNWPIVIAIVLVFNWALFIYVLRYVSMRCCLVR